MGRSRSPGYRGGSPRRTRSRDRGGGGGGYRSPPRRGGDRGGGYGGGEKISLLVRNIVPSNSIADELRHVFERYGTVKDVFNPIDFYTKKPKPFAFIEFINYDDAREAKEDMDRRDFQGRQIDVVFAQQRRKTPEQMRARDGPYPPRGGSRSPRRRGSRSPPRRDDREERRDDRRRDDRDDGSPPRRGGRDGGGSAREGSAREGSRDRRDDSPPPRRSTRDGSPADSKRDAVADD